MTGFREMVESNCGRKIHKGELCGLVGTLKLYNLLQCGTSRTLNGVYKGLLTTGTNCLKRTQQESTAGGMNLLATTGGTSWLHWMRLLDLT